MQPTQPHLVKSLAARAAAHMPCACAATHMTCVCTATRLSHNTHAQLLMQAARLSRKLQAGVGNLTLVALGGSFSVAPDYKVRDAWGLGCAGSAAARAAACDRWWSFCYAGGLTTIRSWLDQLPGVQVNLAYYNVCAAGRVVHPACAAATGMLSKYGHQPTERRAR